MIVKSVFQIDGEHYTVEGYGQDAVSTILQQFPYTAVILAGFLMGEKFIPFQ